MDRPRRTLAGRYELHEIIGRGGMGVVYRARDPVLERAVAVKLLPAASAEQEPQSVARFQREARAAAALSHRGIVAVFDTGVEDGTCFIVMELVDGRSLAAILREEGCLAPVRAAEVAESIADALAAAHATGLVHRDIKPANVMIARDGAVKVLDFGIARTHDATTLTHAGTVLGSAAYMAPEQARGERADARSDVYSLGCLLYAMLAGAPPFRGDNAAALVNQQLNLEPRPPSETNPGVSPALDALVLRMLAKSPRARPQSAAAVRDELARMSGAGDLLQPEPRASAGAAASTPTAVTRVLGDASRSRRRIALAATGLLGLLALGAAVLALAGSGGVSSHAGHRSPRRTAQAPPRPAPSSAPRSTSTTATIPTTTATAVSSAASPGTGPPAPSGHGHGPPAHERKHGRGHAAKDHHHGAHGKG